MLSFDKSAIASCTVVINCAGKMMVEFFSTEISAIVWSAELKCHGMLRDDVGRLAQLHCGLVFPFGSDDLRATLALGLGFLCHGALHIVGKYNVFNFDRRYLRAPRLRVPVDDVLDRLGDARGGRKKLIEANLSADIAHSSLADLTLFPDRKYDSKRPPRC